MNVRERVWAVLEGRMPDKLPQLTYSNFLPQGSFERRMRNMGLGLDIWCSVHRAYAPNVRNEIKTVGDYEYVTTITPLGTLASKRRINLTFQNPGGSWRVEHPVKKPEDLEILEFIIEDTVYEPSYERYLQIEPELGGDGVVTVGAAYTPLMRIIVEFLGYKGFALTLRRNPKAIDEVVKATMRIMAASLLLVIHPGGCLLGGGKDGEIPLKEIPSSGLRMMTGET